MPEGFISKSRVNVHQNSLKCLQGWFNWGKIIAGVVAIDEISYHLLSMIWV